MTALDPCRGQPSRFDPKVLAVFADVHVTSPSRSVWAVSLIDRGTGAPHCVSGTPLVVLSKDRDLAIDHLMDGRDPKVWAPRAVRVARPISDA